MLVRDKAITTGFVLAALASFGSAADFRVTVGIDETTGQVGNGFDPSLIVPSAGDTITFTFQTPSYINNPPAVQHSATQSTFNTPCSALGGGFDSGVQTTGPEAAGTAPQFVYNVTDTNPIWFFSSVGGDCRSGMVLAVNAPQTGDQTAAAFRQRAISGDTSAVSSAASSSASSSASTSSSSDSSTSSTAPSSASASVRATTSASGAASASSASGSLSASASARSGAAVAGKKVDFLGIGAVLGLIGLIAVA